MSNPSHNSSRQENTVVQADESVMGAARDAASGRDADLQFVLRAQAGDTAAFGDLIELHQRAVYGLVSRMVAQRDDVDDIVQDVFVSAWKAIGGFRRDAKFSTWLHTIAVNTTLRRLKTMKNQTALSIDDPDTGLAATIQADESDSPTEILQKRERDGSVRTAIESLPEKHRMVIVMHYFGRQTCDEIASILGCSIGTVWSRLHYACRFLRKELNWLNQDS